MLSRDQRDENLCKDVEGLIETELDKDLRIRKCMVMMLGELMYLGYVSSSNRLAKVMNDTWSTTWPLARK
jgi:hypothetical protein